MTRIHVNWTSDAEWCCTHTTCFAIVVIMLLLLFNFHIPCGCEPKAKAFDSKIVFKSRGWWCLTNHQFFWMQNRHNIWMHVYVKNVFCGSSTKKDTHARSHFLSLLFMADIMCSVWFASSRRRTKLWWLACTRVGANNINMLTMMRATTTASTTALCVYLRLRVYMDDEDWCRMHALLRLLQKFSSVSPDWSS